MTTIKLIITDILHVKSHSILPTSTTPLMWVHGPIPNWDVDVCRNLPTTDI